MTSTFRCWKGHPVYSCISGIGIQLINRFAFFVNLVFLEKLMLVVQIQDPSAANLIWFAALLTSSYREDETFSWLTLQFSFPLLWYSYSRKESRFLLIGSTRVTCSGQLSDIISHWMPPMPKWKLSQGKNLFVVHVVLTLLVDLIL